MEKRFYTANDLADLLPIGKTNLYSLVHSKDFPAISVLYYQVYPMLSTLWKML